MEGGVFQPSRHRAPPLRTLLMVLAVLVLPVVLAYSNIFQGAFFLDDSALIVGNPTIRTLWPPGILQGYVADAQYINQVIHVRLVSNFLFAVNYAFGELDPWGYHAVNLTIHLCNVLLVFGIVRRTLLTPLLSARFGEAGLGLAVATALLWGLHPLLTEAVTYTAQRMESLMALFYLLALYGWIRGVQAGARKWLALSVAACLLGMMSKEVMVTAPAMILLYDGLFLTENWRQALQRRWPWYVGLALCVAWLVFLVKHVPGEHGAFISTVTAPNDRGQHGERWSYAATMPGVILHYLRLLAWPDPLVFDYKWPMANGWQAVLLPGAVIVAGAAAAVWGFARRQAWAYPIAWYLITLSPSSSFLPLYNDYIFEYRAYLPALGPLAFLVLAAWAGLQRIAKARWQRLAGISCGIGILTVLGTLTYARNMDYRTELALWADTVRKAPENDRAHLGLGNALFNMGRYDAAAMEYRRTIRLNPGYSSAHFNLGAILQTQGHLDRALMEYRTALRTGPDDVNSHGNIGTILLQQGHLDAAGAEYRAALRLKPDYADGHNSLGLVLLRQGHPDHAAAEFREALRGKPYDAAILDNLNAALQSPGHH